MAHFCVFKADGMQAQVIKDAINLCAMCTGQLINPRKCSVLCGGTCPSPSDMQKELANILGIQNASLEKYFYCRRSVQTDDEVETWNTSRTTDRWGAAYRQMVRIFAWRLRRLVFLHGAFETMASWLLKSVEP
jgi:hypothetical protein